MRQFLAVPTLALAALGLVPAARADGPLVPRFVEETGTAGIGSVFAGDWEYMVGGGAAAFDCSDDGFPDLFLSGGAGASTFYRNASPQGGALRFEAAPSGLEIEGVAGAYPLDVDSDGKTDLALLRVGENILMRGLGDCRFERANDAWGFDGGDAWSAALAATWEKGAGWPTVAIGNYIDRTQEAFPWGSCTPNWLHRPAAEPGRFAAPLPLTPGFCALSMIFTDWNRSGTQALRVSNDREYYKGGQEQLWHVAPGQPPVLYTAEEGWKPLRIWGMGIAATDLNADGYPDFYLTSMADNKLQTLVPDQPEGALMPTYADVAFARGVTAHRPYTGGEIRPSTAWHPQFEDVNNDGLADLFVVKGNVDRMPDFAQLDPNNLLIQQPDGTFVETGDKAGVDSMRIGRGGAVVDFNLDGLMDIVVVNRRESAQVWRNVTESAGHWLQVRLRQPAPNSDSIGAWIELRDGDRRTAREITVGGGHAGGQLGWWHFGLGASDGAEIRVIWPDGTTGDWQKLEADRFYTLDRSAGALPWTPR